MEGDYGRRRIEQQVYRLLSLVQHIWLELRKLYRLDHRFDHEDRCKIDDIDFDCMYLIVDQHKVMVHSRK